MDKNEAGPKNLVRPTAAVKAKASLSSDKSNSNGSSNSSSVTDSFMKFSAQVASPSEPRSRPGRLPSLRLDKDLTLSPATGKFAIPSSLPGHATGSNPKKKQFTPSIPAKRKPQEVAEHKEVVEEKSHADRGQRGRGDRGRGRGDQRGRGRGKPSNYIQTAGSLYGQGVGGDLAARRPSSSGGGGSSYGGGSAKTSFERPKLNKQDTKINKEDEDARLSRFLRGDFIEDEDDDPDAPIFAPIELPKSSLSDKVKEEVIVNETPILQKIGNITIKQEKIEDDVKEGELVKEEKKPSVSRCLKPVQVAGAQIFQNDGELIFLQLPDVSPTLVPEKERAPTIKIEAGSSVQETPSIQTDQPDKKAAQEDIFKDMADGRLGTLRIHQSGKMTMKMGEHEFEVDSATQVSFLQDLISIDVNTVEKSGRMTVLGPIRYKGIILPDWEKMID